MLSLRAFHLFFILVSTALCLFLLVWGAYDFYLTRQMIGPALSGVGLMGLILLTKYYKWFRSKNFKAMALFAMTLSGANLFSQNAIACSTCYTDPDSLMTKGALMGVVVLGTIIVGVLAFIVVVAKSWLKRAKTLAADF